MQVVRDFFDAEKAAVIQHFQDFGMKPANSKLCRAGADGGFQTSQGRKSGKFHAVRNVPEHEDHPGGLLLDDFGLALLQDGV